jgi:hypothetical protein
METSILTSIKKMLGIAEEYIHFDSDIITHINTVIFRLKTLGVGPETDLIIEDKTAVWDDLLDGRTDLEAVKTYIYLSVKLLFDPPQTSFVIDSIKNQIQIMEWIITEQADGNLEE